MGGINVLVQRLSGDSFVAVADGAEVLPGETLRILVNGLSPLTSSVEITIAKGSQVFTQQNVTHSVFKLGSAWLDTGAPNSEGAYKVTARAKSFTTSYAYVNFQVDKDAPPPPAPPPGGLPSFGDIKTLLIVGGIVVVAVMVVPRLLPKR